MLAQPNFLFYSIALLCNKTFEFEDDVDLLTNDNLNNSLQQTEIEKTLNLTMNEPEQSNFNSDNRAHFFIKSEQDSLNSENDRMSVSLSEVSFSTNESNERTSTIINTEFGNKLGFNIIDIKIISYKTNYEMNTANPYTLYNIQV